ncbi:MAG: chemotaxis response regulator protein-glutamate methylesterase [Chthoniobacteraceae bacterium]|nr:chemotaxis response regulator protein-glutamate methylesterase [Chthoniobacteraceae bacterium]
MPKARVLVVDDSVVIRRLVTDTLNADPDLEVIGVAANGRIALEKLGQLKPDAVVLDVEMPEMDGLETLRQIRKTHFRLPVIMFSTVTARGFLATLDALAAGATDYVTKPANVGGVGEALDRLRRELIPKIKHFCGVKPSVLHEPARPPAAPAPLPKPLREPSRIDVVVIGVSTGGPDALVKLMPALPADLPVPILVVQHMPPVFTKLLADRLSAMSGIWVKEAEPGEHLSPGGVWIAPGDFHLTVCRQEGHAIVRTTKGPPENSCRPSVDVLFRSAVEAFGGHVLGVVLTGMGRDGFRGSELIRNAGGDVFAQDEATSVIWGMPGFVARGGLANAVLPLQQIPAEIVKRVHLGRTPTPSRHFPQRDKEPNLWP